ncbi:MAG: Zn-ribbon domain-containing OB-fold protein [Spirochaetota bacterium]|nr:Zn-ribbon domain-containing OB-fold protein [Spirochaetota bacterium]
MSNKTKLTETQDGTIVFNLPFPRDLDDLRSMSPIVIKRPYLIDYIYSYGQDSPFFAALSNKIQLGTKCNKCNYSFANPRLACTYCGGENSWIKLPEEGEIHTFTVCYFGSEKFLAETPFILGLISYEGINTLFLTRLIGLNIDNPSLDWIGMKVKRQFIRNSKLLPTDVYYLPVGKVEK